MALMGLTLPMVRTSLTVFDPSTSTLAYLRKVVKSLSRLDRQPLAALPDPVEAWVGPDPHPLPADLAKQVVVLLVDQARL